MKLAWIAAAAAALLLPGTAQACLPPMPGEHEPTVEEKARFAYEHSTNIVYGITLDAANGREKVRFKILHVYKGSLKAGDVVSLEHGWGYDPPPCFGMIGMQPLPKGAWGVAGFSDLNLSLNWIDEPWLKIMFANGWIKSARAAAAAAPPPAAAQPKP
jgi:hypothetical protein